MGVVKIHVFDEARCLRQDFACEHGTLLSSMQYFRSYLKRVSPAQDAEISVQCDVAVFSWLLQYAKAAAAGQQLPALSIANCMPVLISSDFLQMEELKSSALSFIAKNFAAVADLSHDLAGLADSLLSRLAKGVSEDGLEDLWQSYQPRSQDEGDNNQPLPSSPALQPFRSHLLVQRLYKHKVDHMIREPATALSRCTQCGEIFSAAYRHKLKCEAGLGSEGDPLACAFRRHILDRGWKVQRLIQELRKQEWGWREIYWKLWGLAHVLLCSTCLGHFPAADLPLCRHHPDTPLLAQGRSSGVYPCCGRTAQLGPTHQRPLPQSGCAFQPHTPLTPPEAPIYNLSSDSVLCDSVQKTQTVGLVHVLMKHQSLIVMWPRDVKQEQAESSRPAQEEHDGHQDSRAHQAVSSSTYQHGLPADEEEDEDDEPDSRDAISGGSMQNADAMRPLLGSAADPLYPHNSTLLAGLKPSNPKLQKAVWQDLIREDDAKQMDALIAKLDSMRSQRPPDVRPSKPVKKDQAGMRVSMSRSSSGRPDSVQSLKPPVPRAGTAAGNVRPARQRSCSVGRRRVTS
ncbi:TPA: hypothetical protein ACH3X1_015842 [Trebouxia sp. C0004]